MQLPLEISCEEVHRLMQAKADYLLWDCREPVEFRLASLEGAAQLPLSELQTRINELTDHVGRRVVVMCHHGVRSLQAAAWLREQGFAQAQSMAGGIDAWAIQIDSTVDRY